METEKIYERSFDTPLMENGAPKQSKFLGEFKIIETLNDNSYSSQRLGVLVGTADVYLINEYEVSGRNGGSRFEVKEITTLMAREKPYTI